VSDGINVSLDFLRAVGNIGVDFGYGEYSLDDEWIKYARDKAGELSIEIKNEEADEA